MWTFTCSPTFEYDRKRGDQVSDDIEGIYCLKDKEGRIVYIGQGRIKERISFHSKKDWIWDKYEYSPLADKDECLKWESKFIDKYKEDNYDARPLYNRIDGHHA